MIRCDDDPYRGDATVKGTMAMKAESPKRLPAELNISCYACEVQKAVYLCRYAVGELAVQVCLCRDCMKLDTNHLLKNTIGIQEHASQLASDYLSE